MNFENMTDREVEMSLKTNVAQERKILHVILQHIREVDARRMHLKSGYESLRAYLIGEMGYSSTSADRRVEAANLMKDVPAIAEKVREGNLNLSQIGEVHSAIKQKERISRVKVSAAEKLELVESVVGLTTQQAQQQLSHTLEIPVRKFEKVRVQADGSVVLEFTLSKEAFENLNTSKNLSAQKLAQDQQEINLANTMAHVLNQFVNGKMQKTSAAPKSPTHCKTDAVPTRVNKTVTPKTRQYVLKRTGCCEFKNPHTGKVCGSKFALQADHIRSRKLGGDHSTQNLQTLCARHNRFKYEQEKNMEMRFFG